MKKITTKIKKHSTFFCLLFLFFFITMITLFSIRKGLLRGHDIAFHLSRIKGLKDSIGFGDWRALIHPELYGYGYANGLFYGNLFLYLPALLSLMGLSYCKAYVLFTWLCTILTGLTMFLLIKRITRSNYASTLSAILYTCSAYRICDLIVRAAIGEILAFMIIPIVILGLYEIIYGNYKKWYYFSIGFVLLIQAHIISSVFIAIICMIIILVNLYKLMGEKVRIKCLIYSGIVGILLGAFFLFPLLEQYSLGTLMVNHAQNNIGSTYLPIERIFLGFSYYSNATFYPTGIGLILIFVSLLRFKLKTKDQERKKLADLFLIFGMISLLCVTSFFPWKELSKYVGFLQFAWRLYLVATVLLSISSGILLSLYDFKKARKKVFVILIMLQTLSTGINIYYSFNSVHNYWGVTGMEYINNWDDYDIAMGEYLPYKTDTRKLQERGEKITSNDPNLKIKYKKVGNKIVVEYSNNKKKNTYLDLPLLYYKGYQANSDKQNIKLGPGPNNIIRVQVASKEDKFVVYYKGTMIQKISYLISGITAMLGTFYLCRRSFLWQKRNNKKKA